MMYFPFACDRSGERRFHPTKGKSINSPTRMNLCDCVRCAYKLMKCVCAQCVTLSTYSHVCFATHVCRQSQRKHALQHIPKAASRTQHKPRGLPWATISNTHLLYSIGLSALASNPTLDYIYICSYNHFSHSFSSGSSVIPATIGRDPGMYHPVFH